MGPLDAVSWLFAVPVVFVWLGAAPLASGEQPMRKADRSIYSRDGLYMGGRGIFNVSDFDLAEAKVLELDPPGAGVIENGWGFGVTVGYRTHGLFAGEVDMEIADPGFRLNGEKLGGFGMTLYAKAYPLELLPSFGGFDRFQPYVKVGPGFQYFYRSGTVDPVMPELDGEISEVGFVGRFGAGCEFYLSKQLALTFDATYALGTGSINGMNYTALGVVGLQWRFSAK